MKCEKREVGCLPLHKSVTLRSGGGSSRAFTHFPLLFWISITQSLMHIRKNYYLKFMLGLLTFLREGERTMNKLSVDVVTTYKQFCWGHYKVWRTVSSTKIYWFSGFAASGKELSSQLKPHTMQNCIQFFIVSSPRFPSWMESLHRAFSHPPHPHPTPSLMDHLKLSEGTSKDLHKEILYKEKC